MTIIARVDEATEFVGTYAMGANPPAGDHYVLRVRMESGADGAPQSANAARAGQTVHVFVREGQGPEQHAADVVIDGSGFAAEPGSRRRQPARRP